MRSMIVPVVALLAACAGRAPVGDGVEPSQGATVAIEAFMDAVADSNLVRMAELWGTNQGSAATTGNPTGYGRRIQIMYSFLAHSTAEVLSPIDRRNDRVVMIVNLTRRDCRRRVSFTTVRARDGQWLVNAIDLAAAGTPGKPCPPENRVPPA